MFLGRWCIPEHTVVHTDDTTKAETSVDLGLSRLQYINLSKHDLYVKFLLIVFLELANDL